MALKDWKKIRDNKREFTYYHKKHHYTSVNASNYNNDKIWILFVVVGAHNVRMIHFKTKSQALKFAKSYMKKH